MFSPVVCHQKLLEIVHREEVKVNWILSAKVEFLNSEKGPRDWCKLQHFTLFKTPKNGARTERTWYLIWKTADPCLLKAGHSECWWMSFLSFRYKSFRDTFKVNFVSKVTSRKKIWLKCFRLRNTFCDFLFKRNAILIWWQGVDWGSYWAVI